MAHRTAASHQAPGQFPNGQALDAARNSGVPVAVFYESPHRVLSLVGRIAERFPECALAVFCDLTKKFEWMRRGSPEDVLNALRENPNLEKGEYCVVCDLGALPPVEKPPSAGQSAVAVMADSAIFGDLAAEPRLQAAAADGPRQGHRPRRLR